MEIRIATADFIAADNSILTPLDSELALRRTPESAQVRVKLLNLLRRRHTAIVRHSEVQLCNYHVATVPSAVANERFSHSRKRIL
jgi:hypothetical protein